MSEKRFRVAFSYAGEKREFVAQVANILAARFGKPAILYDKFHEAEFARRDLGIYLPDLYNKQSDLIVAVLCADYEHKEWCGLEWVAIHARLKNRADKEVMLTRFDLAQVAGIYETAGFVELDHKTPEETAELILQRLTLNEGTPATASPPVLETTIPNNLPRLQSFFGRENELAAILDALEPEARTWGVLIQGPGGMGKTSIAIRAAYDCPPDLFKKIIFVSVKDRELDDDGVRALGSLIVPGFLGMLNEIARELGHADIAKSPEDQRIRLVLDALRPAQALLVLDNLESLTKEDRDQLFTFVRRLPQGCKAILTSRLRIGTGSELLILEMLDEAAALDMLADLAEHNPLLAKTNEAERVTLYRQTGGKPLLMRWVAGQLGRGNCRTFTDALHFLRSCPKDNDPLEFIFGDLAREFTADETRVLVALAYFTLPTSVNHIVEVADIDEESASVALRGLANRSLVIPDQEERLFTLVPMVADFLRRARPEVVAETGSRLEKRAYALIVENGGQHYERFPVLDAAWTTVSPALPLFASSANERLQDVCVQLHYFLQFTGRWDEWLSLAQQAESKSVAVGDYSRAGWRAKDICWVHYLRGQSDGVMAAADRAAAHWEAAKTGAYERAHAIRLRGLGYYLRNDYPLALAAYREALGLWRTFGEIEEVAIVLNAIGNVEKDTRDLEAAERDYREAIRVATAVDDRELMAIIPANLAAVALDREDWPQAEALARDTLTKLEDVGRKEVIAWSCHLLASALMRQGKQTEALPFAKRAVDIFTSLQSPRLESALQILAQCESP